MAVLARNMPYFLRSFGVTIMYCFVTLVGASIIGVFVAIVYSLIERRLVRSLITMLINAIRGLPLLVVLFSVYYLLPFFGVDLDRTVAALLGMITFFSASISEVFRGAIQSVPSIQVDVAKALGMRRLQCLRHVILPLASRLLVGPMIGEFVRIVKGSTLLSLLTIPELMLAAREVTTATFKGVEVFGVVGLMYFIFIFTCSRIGQKLEKRLVSEV